jgi:hypothetical protein
MSVTEFSVASSEDAGPSEKRRGGALQVERATTKDFERVYPLLLDFNIARLSRENWRRLFTNDWQDPEGYCGYLLVQDGDVKGYLGLLFSTREINDRVEKFCNMTSWIVRAECRNQSLRLLLELLKLKEYTITNFTASPTVAAILRKLGFAEMKMDQRLVFPFPGLGLSQSRYCCSADLEQIRQFLNPGDQAIFDDHQGFNCRHALISNDAGYCYLVVKNRVYRHLPFARIHYLSNRALFFEALDSVRTGLCRKLKIAGLMIDKRYLGTRMLRFSRDYQGGPAFFKSKSLAKNDIDTIYSEVVLLHD